MSNFWERLRQQQEAEQRANQPPRRSDGPWWAEGSNIGQTAQNPAPDPQNVTQPHIGADGHDYSKAMHLKQQGTCPMCGGTNYMKARSDVSRRCWDCGHNEGRDVHDPSLPTAVTMEGPAQRAMQTAAGGASVSNYHPNPYDAANNQYEEK